MFVHIYIYIYIYMHTHTHTHIYIYIYSKNMFPSFHNTDSPRRIWTIFIGEILKVENIFSTVIITLRVIHFIFSDYRE